MTRSRAEFEERFAELHAVAYQTAYRLTGRRASAEAVAQDALARTYLSWRRVAGDPIPAILRHVTRRAPGTTREPVPRTVVSHPVAARAPVSSRQVAPPISAPSTPASPSPRTVPPSLPRTVPPSLPRTAPPSLPRTAPPPMHEPTAQRASARRASDGARRGIAALRRAPVPGGGPP